MSGMKTYSSYAVLCELSRREFRKKLALFPEEMRPYVVLAAGVIGAELAKRSGETPEAVVRDGREFASDLLEIADPGQDESFRNVLETYLVETLKDELRYNCPNCANFHNCLDMEDLPVGSLFRRRTAGEETDELRKEIAFQVDRVLQRTPHIDTDSAQTQCKDFRHQYSADALGEVFGRYAGIAAGLQDAFGIDYRKVQQQMILLNMDFCRKSGG
jgi:hypothetical protein